jgi:hypothetical protein
MTRGKRSEHSEQVTLFNWAAAQSGRWPELRYMFAIPNGGHRVPAVAAKMKAEGTKAGVLDICLPVPRGPHHSFWLEMKYGRNKLTDEQKVWLDFLVEQGHRVEVAYSFEEARDYIIAYLEGA